MRKCIFCNIVALLHGERKFEFVYLYSSTNKPGVFAHRKLLATSVFLLFQLQAVPESFAHAFGDFVVAMSIGVKGNGIHKRHIDFSVFHHMLIGSNIDHLTDDSATVFSALILNKFTCKADGEFVDNGGVHGFGFAAVRPLRANLSATRLPDSTPK